MTGGTLFCKVLGHVFGNDKGVGYTLIYNLVGIKKYLVFSI